MATTGTWCAASTILADAGVPEDHSYYREFTGTHEASVLTVGLRIRAAWAANDADAFAAVFTDDGSLLLRDVQLTGRESIRNYLTAGFDGPLKGAHVQGWPVHLTFLTDDVAMFVTEGGIMFPGHTDIQPENYIRSIWLVSKGQDGRPYLVSHQSCPVKR